MSPTLQALPLLQCWHEMNGCLYIFVCEPFLPLVLFQPFNPRLLVDLIFPRTVVYVYAFLICEPTPFLAITPLFFLVLCERLVLNTCVATNTV
eukprot:m.117671 g.117671  ORF g.117671 m.117671 type:complete len:93 (+) comp13631_c0_seq1:1489-1767(+)